VHRLTDDVFAEHRPERGAAVAATREACLTGAFQLYVEAHARRRHLLAKQNRAAVAERGEVAELVAGVGLRNRSGAGGQHIAGEDRGSRRTIERRRIESHHGGERPVERG
jgi:hypothetical protein